MKKKIVNVVLIIMFLTYYALTFSNFISIRIFNEIGTYICEAIVTILLFIYVLKCKNKAYRIVSFIICFISLLYLIFNLFLMITGGPEKVIQSYKIDNSNSLESVYYLDVKEITSPIEIRYKHKIIGPVYCQQTIYIINDNQTYLSEDEFMAKHPLETVYNNFKITSFGMCGRELVSIYKKEIYYQELKDSIQEDISSYIKIHSPYCSVGSATSSIDEKILIIQAGVDKQKFLDIDGKSYCKVKVNVKCIAENEHSWDTYLKCIDYEDEGYNHN